MKPLKKLWHLIFAFSCLIGSSMAFAEDYQRYITFYNDFDFPIYPVIQVPADTCEGSESNGDKRIIVNGVGHKGLNKNEKLTVLIPNTSNNAEKGQPILRCWYRSGRIYIFPVDVTWFEKHMVDLNPAIANQATTRDVNPKVPNPTCYSGDYIPNYKPDPSNLGDCYTGTSGASYALDTPAQLAEYTFDSDNANGQNDPDSGVAMADIDVSSVDELYLPVAASVSNHGATGYMGSAMPISGKNNFKDRIDTFTQAYNKSVKLGQWPIFGSFQAANWATNAFHGDQNGSQMPSELGGLAGTDILAHVPGGYNILVNTLSRPIPPSPLYGDDKTSYMISGMGSDLTQHPPNNPIVQQYVDRFMYWVNLNHDWINGEPNDPCAPPSIGKLIWPDAFTSQTSTNERLNFCQKFRDNAQSLWDAFYANFNSNKDKYYKDCGLSTYDPKIIQADPNITHACVLQHIVGYNSEVLGGELPGRVQALLRSVAYDPKDGSHQYQFDPFLTFSAPYNSQFSVDPYTRLIHSNTDGVGAVAYSFSIDDKYGNFRDASNGFIIDAGGTTALTNKRPYDPYQQYRISWGYNRDPFSLVWVQEGVNLQAIQPQLQTIAANYKNYPFIIRQGNSVSVLGHADPTSGNDWKLTNPLTTLAELQIKAQQEANDQIGKTHPTHNYQNLIDRIWGTNTVPSIFPSIPLNVGKVDPNALVTLNFDAVPDSWAGGAADFYALIIQNKADITSQNNWKSLTLGCPDPLNPITIAINGPGNQTIPFAFVNNQYLQCKMVFQDTLQIYTLALNMGPVQPSPIPTDNYTGSKVNGTLWGLPIGKNFSGDPLITSDLSAADLQYCQQNSSSFFADPPNSGCGNVNLAATWSGDPLSRDTVYMGLDPKDMPRVFINAGTPPAIGPDPEQPFWPKGAVVTANSSDGKTLHVNWTKASVLDPKVQLRYGLTLKNADGSILPIPLCDASYPGGFTLQTQCDASIPATASYPLHMEVIALNFIKPDQPPVISQILKGDYTYQK